MNRRSTHRAGLQGQRDATFDADGPAVAAALAARYAAPAARLPKLVRRALRAAQPEEWRDDAACAGQDPRWWFPGRAEPITHGLAVCAGCPVRRACLAFALEHAEQDGMWGGLPPEELRPLRARVEAASSPAEVETLLADALGGSRPGLAAS